MFQARTLSCLLLFLFCCLLTPALSAQGINFDESRKTVVDLTRSGPGFVNFRFGTPINNIYGLQNGTYTTSIEGTSILRVAAQNIGQVVIYARLISSSDTSIFVDNPNLHGSISISPIAANRSVEQARGVYEFNGKETYRQIYYITQTIGVDEVAINFEAENGYFIVSKVEVVPYTPYGLDYLRNRLEYVNRLSSKPDRYRALRFSYTEELQRIEDYHKVLNELIGREESASLARLKTRAYNPFNSPEFVTYYNTLIEKANTAEQADLTRVREDIAKFDFQGIALTVDNLLLGGKFSTLINLVGTVFDNEIQITDTRNRPQTVIKLDGKEYFRDDKGSKIRLELIDDPAVLRQVRALSEKNQQFQNYIQQLQQYIGQDLDLQNRINQEVQIAKSLVSELERLEWEILDDFTDRPRTDFIDAGRINYSMTVTELNRQFPSVEAAPLDFLDREELKIRTVSNTLKDIRGDYQRLLGNMKTNYDNLYMNYPQDRIGAFQKQNQLPPNLGETWNGNQLEIIKTYRGSNLVVLLERALSSL